MDGWPEPYQLDADLWQWFDEDWKDAGGATGGRKAAWSTDQAPPERMDLAVQEALRGELHCNEAQFAGLVHSLVKTVRKLDEPVLDDLMEKASVEPWSRAAS